jgi:hypothetical protein
VIVCNVTAASAAKAVTSTVPIVFATGYDPIGEGLVTSLNRPGGNVTGVSFLGNALKDERAEKDKGAAVVRLRPGPTEHGEGAWWAAGCLHNAPSAS